MKIGILTYHSVCNFGANLQALSTYSYFKKRGFEVVVINWMPHKLQNIYFKNISQQQQIEHSTFVEKFLSVTDLCRTSEDVKNIIKKEKIDAVVIGSDAVFSYIPFLKRIHPSRRTILGISSVSEDHEFPNPFWGDFKTSDNPVKVFAMSASAQYLDFNKCFFWTKKALRKALLQFNSITVRDRWTQNIISQLINKNIEITPDPVFAFNHNVSYQSNPKELLEKYQLPSKYIIFSFCKQLFSEQWYQQLYDIFKKKDYTVVNLAMPEGCIKLPCDIQINIPISPMEWYEIIKLSSGYIGQRMHPMIVAFHNIVPFFVFDHYAYKKHNLASSKIYDLLERANFLSNYYNIKGENSIQPEEVAKQLLNFDKEKAIEFNRFYYEKYNQMMHNIISHL